jgi:hypothetical protein
VAAGPPLRFAPKQTVFWQGEPTGWIYQIVEGRVQLSVVSAHGSERFMAFLLSRTIEIQADLVDQLFNSSERRLVRVLLLLANFGKNGTMESVVPKSQSGTAGSARRHDPLADQLLHEQVPQARPDRMQRRTEGALLAGQRDRARVERRRRCA